MTEYERFIEELVYEIMGEIYFDDVKETTYTLEDFEEFSGMYEVKKRDIIKLVKRAFADKTIINGKPLN